MNVIGYVRVSTAEQAEGGVSLDAQESKIKLYAELHGLTIVEIVVDAGVSAKTLDRPGLQRALAILRSGRADGLVVAKLDRLSRSVKDWNDLIDRVFGDKGKTLMSVADSIDTRTAAGRLVLNVLMSVAQWEREAIGERTRDALAELKAQGKPLGAAMPQCRNLTAEARQRGSRASGEASRKAAAESDSFIRPVVIDLHAQGLSLGAIARRLNEMGYKTRGGAEWSTVQVRRVLSRAAVAA